MNKKEPIAKMLQSKPNNDIPLILESYNDLFSDFDPRPISERALSDDFLIECKRAALDKKPGFDLSLLLPESKRDLTEEIKIKKRLRNHFLKHYLEKLEEQKKLKKQGFAWFLIGGLLALGATYLSINKTFFARLLFVLLEPAGWFTLWSGLDTIFFRTKEKLPDFRFYKKMAHAKVYFSSIKE